MKRKSKWHIFDFVKGVGLPLLILVILLGFFTGVSDLKGGSEDQDRRQLEESIRRVAAACYAAEGIYPPTLEYMTEHYGLQINEDRYVVDYQAFASNIMPTFTVLKKTEE